MIDHRTTVGPVDTTTVEHHTREPIELLVLPPASDRRGASLGSGSPKTPILQTNHGLLG
jgi:hypothetical protein